MKSSQTSSAKQSWSTPEIVDVGDIATATGEKTGNVRDPGSNPMTYDMKISRDPLEEVDLGDN